MIHPGLEWLRDSPEGGAWLDRLPRLVETCAERWDLRLGDSFPNAFESLVLSATQPDGTDVVLKIAFPGRENEHEAAALALWNGDGAIRLLDRDAEHHALLLERCRPGTPLSELPSPAALDVIEELLPRLWKPAGAPFRPLAEEAIWWAGYLPDLWERGGRPFERYLLDAALDALGTLPETQGEAVLVHQDLHADNVLRAEREPWLAIDPKPLTGEREFGIAAIVRGRELGHAPELLHHRLDRLTADLGLDRDRARRWALAQTLAWAFDDDGVLQQHLDCVRWLLEA